MMSNSGTMIVALAEACRDSIRRSDETGSMLPPALQRKRLLWMCDRIEEHSEDWPATRLHQWIGFVQCAMIANQMVDLDHATAMFRELNPSDADGRCDGELMDHLDPHNGFELDLGGEG